MTRYAIYFFFFHLDVPHCSLFCPCLVLFTTCSVVMEQLRSRSLDMAGHTALPYNATMFARAYIDLAVLDDMTSRQFNQWSHTLDETQTGCYNPGSLPIALANNDTCLLGFYCKISIEFFPISLCSPI